MAYPKKILVALPPGLLAQVDFIAQTEHRTRSDLIREALRRYIDNFRRENANVSNVAREAVMLQQDSGLAPHASLQ